MRLADPGLMSGTRTPANPNSAKQPLLPGRSRPNPIVVVLIITIICMRYEL